MHSSQYASNVNLSDQLTNADRPRQRLLLRNGVRRLAIAGDDIMLRAREGIFDTRANNALWVADAFHDALTKT